MPNPIVEERLRAMLQALKVSYDAGAPMSSSTKGSEREAFISQALSNVIAPPFRVGSGDITDATGARSGQMDTVIEFDNSISFPMSPTLPRLYLAEGVCAVIEVKSNLEKQWSEVVRSHSTLAPIRRNLNVTALVGDRPFAGVPHFAVGFTGWKTRETAERHRIDSDLHGLLIVDSQLYVGKRRSGQGPWALLAFFAEIQFLTKQMLGFQPDPLDYAK